MEADFSGYVTKVGLKCTDGRTVMPDAFKHMDKLRVPLVWMHGHDTPDNILGHVILEHRADGLYGYGFFNDTPQGQNSKKLVEHKDVGCLSIWANQLLEKSKQVFHGIIREVSLVLAGANPGAFIDNVNISHSDGQIETLATEAIIFTGLALEHENMKADLTTVSHADGSTVQDVYDAFDSEQKSVVNFLIGAALEAAQSSASHSDGDKPKDATADDKSKDTKEGDLSHKEGTDDMTRNVFENADKDKKKEIRHMVSRDDVKLIVADAMKGGSLKQAVEAYALKHNIDNIDTLFPDAKAISTTPEFDKRRTEWVAGVMNGTRHVPFSRIKTLSANLTYDDARAKGYIKGTFKKEEFFGVTKRTTAPTTVYKKQKLDRDDIIDITDFDVVAWLKTEMRMMLDEEIARAIMIGDGRAVDDEDKIKDPIGTVDGTGIRSIVNDNELYVTTAYVNLDDEGSSMLEFTNSVISSRQYYKGTGMPTLYTTETWIAKMLLTTDTLNRRYWKNLEDLASDLRVASIVPVEVMDETDSDIVAIMVNLTDYALGTDKGGDVNMFDDFDIDCNQYKYLIETRLSGALTKIKSAIVFRKTAVGNVLVAPNSPTFVPATGVVTIVATTGVVYKNADTAATLSTGAQTALAAGATLNVKAFPASGYYFETDANDEWAFTRPAA